MGNNDKINYYLDIAQEVLESGTCLRHNCGVIIVSNDRIISTGYSHIVRQDEALRDRDPNIDLSCRKPDKLLMAKGECYGDCRVAHAETTAIIGIPRELMLGATLYLVGKDMKYGELITDLRPCSICLRHIIRAGIAWVVARISSTDYNVVNVGVDCVQKGDSLTMVNDLY